MAAVDMTGKRCAKLTVVERANNDKYGNSMWVCKCDCGNTIVTLGRSLRSGNTKSCGCLNKENGRPPNDLTGKRFGKLTVLKQVENQGINVRWLCRCDCGNEKKILASNLTGGKSETCGCSKTDILNERNTSHGMSKTRIYTIWSKMKNRCTNPNCKGYDRYGGRGIYVCQEWLNSFQSFLDWAQKNGYTADLTLDRKDNDGPYSPENCRWVSMKKQSNNRSTNHLVEYNGETHTVSEWADLVGIRQATLLNRLRKGWPIEKALTKDPHR